MSEITEKSIREELGITPEMLSNTEGPQTAILAPGEHHYFYNKPGRNYMVSVTNMDDSYTVDCVGVYDLETNHCRKLLENIQPLRNESVIAKMDKNGIRVYNWTKEGAPGRPKVFVSVYSA